MTRISKRFITWLLAAIAFVAIAFGFALVPSQTKTASAATVEVVWKEAGIEVQDFTDYKRFLVQTEGVHWTSYNNQSYADNYLAYTKLNGKTVKEINAEAKEAGSSQQIWACLQPAGSFSFYSVCIPKTFETLLPEDVFSLSIEAGWTHLDSSTNPTYPGTGNDYKNSTQVLWSYRDDSFKKNTGKYADFSTASPTFISQGDQKDGSTCFLFSTRDTANFWTAYSTVLKLNNPILNAIYINDKSINDWNAEAQDALANGSITDICYGSTNGNNTTAGAPIAVRPGFASDANIGAFFQIYIANEFLSSVDIHSFEWKAGFAFMLTGTRDVYYTSKDIRFDLFGESWKQITEFVDLGDGNMSVENQGDGSYSGINCFLIRFGVREKIANYLCFNDQYQRVNPLTGLRYGENLDYITINGKTIGQIKAENPNYNYSASTHPNIKLGGSYAPIFVHMSSTDFGKGKENFIQIYIPKDLIDPSAVTEIGLKSDIFNLNGTVKYGLTKDVTFVKENGTWGMKPIEIDTEITSVHASIQNFLTFGLSNHDYKNISPNTLVDKARLTASGLWDYIEVNGVKLTKDTTGESVYNIYGRATNTYSVRLSQYPSDEAEGDITSVTVKAGARFPSYAYNSTGVGIPIYYVVKEDVTFVYDSTNGWHIQVAPKEYTVTFVDGDGNTFATQTVLEGEKAIEPEGTPTKTNTEDYAYNFIGWYVGETEFDFENTAINGDITITAKFSEEEITNNIATSILSVEWGLNGNNFLAFELGTHDYTDVAVPKEISRGDGMLKATNMLDKIYFDGKSAREVIGGAGTNPHLNIFTMGKFGFRIGTANKEFPYKKITVEAGCEFLSNAYIQGNSDSLFVTTEDYTFVDWYGSIVEEDSIPVTQIVDVVRLTYAEQDNWLVFTFDEIDYPKGNDIYNYEVSSAYLNKLRFFDYVEVTGSIRLNRYENGQITGVNVVEKATLAEIYNYNGKPASGMINIWKQQNTFAIRISADKDGVYSTVTSITMKEGAEFPSYQATKTGNAEESISYMLLNQAEFEKEAGDATFTCTTKSSYGIDMWMSQGAAVRIADAEHSGIRFQTNISKTALAEIEKKLADGTYLSVSFGTIIVPSQYLMGGRFTHEWLNKNDKEYIEIESTAGLKNGWAQETDDYVSYFGSIVNLKIKNYARNFAGLGYALVEKSDGTLEYFYAPYETSYARSAAYIAQMAIADRAGNKTDDYKYEVSENNNWSPYTDGERAFLALYLGELAESVIPVSDLSSGLANIGNTVTLDMKKDGLAQQIGSYIHLTYSTNINVLGTLVYGNAPNATKWVEEEFYLQAGSGEHKQYLDLFRKNGLGYYNGTPGSYSSTRLINPDSVYLQKIIFKNVELETGVVPQVQLVGFRSTYKTLETSDLPGNSVHLYLTREQTEDEKVASEYNEVTIGANLALGGALTYVAKSGVYEGLTSAATKRSYAVSSQGQYTKGTVGMSTDTSVFKYTDPISGLNYIGGSGVGSSKPGVGVNLISNQDVGRQIQQSYYAAVGGTDGATNGENGYTRAYCYTESSSGKYWPYNPVQAGDCGNNTSQIIDYELNTEKNYIYVKTRAMDWAQAIDDRLSFKDQKNAIR
ncbi:MAG: InlB B-repeat-containing protein, partial [Clostridia bacterium]|nr:InlB B-repeat-containing protein [Clostridia bacterium]